MKSELCKKKSNLFPLFFLLPLFFFFFFCLFTQRWEEIDKEQQKEGYPSFYYHNKKEKKVCIFWFVLLPYYFSFAQQERLQLLLPPFAPRPSGLGVSSWYHENSFLLFSPFIGSSQQKRQRKNPGARWGPSRARDLSFCLLFWPPCGA